MTEEDIKLLKELDLEPTEVMCLQCCKNILDVVKNLKAENAELRRQLEQATKLPCKVGDTLFTITFALSDGYDEAGVLHTAGWQISETIVTEKNLYRMCELVQKHKAFISREAAEAEGQRRLEILRNKYKKK